MRRKNRWNRRWIMAVDGGSNDGGGGDGQQDQQDQKAKTELPADDASKTQNNGKEQDISSLPDWAQAIIKDARGEAAKERVNAKEQAAKEARESLLAEFAKTLGLKSAEEDPAKVAAQLQEKVPQLEGQIGDLQRQLDVHRLAGAAGGDALALLDSNSFLKTLSELKPYNDDAVSKAITDAVKKNPKLNGRASRSGGEAPGGEARAKSTASMYDAIKAKLAEQGKAE